MSINELNLPKNPLEEKWAKLYPPIPMPHLSQVCDGYSCMWCGRCPRGEYWECPEEDKAVYSSYLADLQSALPSDWMHQVTLDLGGTDEIRI